MSHPYPPRWSAFDYISRHHHAFTFVTDARHSAFIDAEPVALALSQILRAAGEEGFALTVYCFLPDHLHMVVEGTRENSECKAFIKAAKQYSAYYHSKECGRRLWERYGHDRVIRDDSELVMTVGYIVANPVRAGLVKHPAEYPYLGPQQYTVAELLQLCEYSEATALD